MTYHEWLERFASLTPETRGNLRRKILVLDDQPLISVILPVYNSDLKFLERAIASIRRQIYENWEVCLADDASTDLRIKPFLENLTRAKIVGSKSSFATRMVISRPAPIPPCRLPAANGARSWIRMMNWRKTHSPRWPARLRETRTPPSFIRTRIFSMRMASVPTRSLNRIGTLNFSSRKITSIILASTALRYFTRSAGSAKDSRARRITI